MIIIQSKEKQILLVIVILNMNGKHFQPLICFWSGIKKIRCYEKVKNIYMYKRTDDIPLDTPAKVMNIVPSMAVLIFN